MPIMGGMVGNFYPRASRSCHEVTFFCCFELILVMCGFWLMPKEALKLTYLVGVLPFWKQKLALSHPNRT